MGISEAIPPGDFRGSASCVESSTTNYQGFMHELGTVRVGSLGDTEEDLGLIPGRWRFRDGKSLMLVLSCQIQAIPLQEGFDPPDISLFTTLLNQINYTHKSYLLGSILNQLTVPFVFRALL